MFDCGYLSNSLIFAVRFAITAYLLDAFLNAIVPNLFTLPYKLFITRILKTLLT